MVGMRNLKVVMTVAALVAVCAAYSDEDAAKCVSEGTGCSCMRAEKAKHWCRGGRTAEDQDPCCKHKACAYCRTHSWQGFCGSDEIKSVCGSGLGNHFQCMQGHTAQDGGGCGSDNSGYTDGLSHSRANGGHHKQYYHQAESYTGYKSSGSGYGSGGGQCVWKMGYGKNSLVINPSGSATGDWVESGDSITYKPGDYNPHKIDKQGSSTITYKFQVNQAGSYYFTARTTAAMHTEHNDVWVKCSAGLKLVSMAHKGSSGYNYGWLKAYQNEFANSMTLYSKDHDPHQMVTGWLNAGQTYDLQISGRSTRFKIERLVLARCQGGCMKYEHSMKSAVADLSVSQCD